jgi:hypothetical protein
MRTNSHAFTRIELTAVISALVLLGALAMPLLATTRKESERSSCFNNLRQLGLAVATWGNDHNYFAPWRTRVSEGGTQPDSGSKSAAAWTELITLSNQLVTPQVLACPSDSSAKAASHWGSTTGGFANTGYRNNAASYFVSFHSVPHLPRSVVCGDRDFRPSFPGTVSCAYGPNNAAYVTSGAPPVVWTNALHSNAGHILLSDGSVVYTDSSRLLNVLIGSEAQNDNTSVHLIFPR